MAHGYLRDWDEGWGRSDDREGDDGDWRDRQRDRGRAWDDRSSDRHSAFMLGDRDRSYGGRMGEARDRFREDDRWSGRDDWNRAPRDFRSHQDDHYLSWRDKQMAELDRDYADYCREREQQFHQDFGEWRQRRAGNPQPLRTGMTQTGMSHDPTGELQLTTDSSIGPVEPEPTSDATLGTNSAEGAPLTGSRSKPRA